MENCSLNIPLNELPKERDRSGTRYQFSAGPPVTLTDTEKGKSYQLNSSLAQTPEFQKMFTELVTVANRRVDTFDPLLNSYEAMGCILNLLTENFLELFTSGLMQPVIDLDACVHNLVAGRNPGIVYNRSRFFDGGYRWLETLRDLRQQGKEPRIPTSTPIRPYSDMHEARIVLAYRALLAGRSRSDAQAVMKKLLETYKIRNVDDEPDQFVTIADVESLSRYVEDNDKSLGRVYCWEKLKKSHSGDLEACSNPIEGKKFAEQVLARASWKQPRNYWTKGLA
jgi:hypothetical protein